MINIYSKPSGISLVDKLYVPPVELLGKALEVKQSLYDKNMAESMSLIDSVGAKVKAVGYHRQLADQVLNEHQENLYKAVNSANGDFSVITPMLLKTKQNLSRDLSPNGVLGKINAYAELTNEWDKTYKNDKNDQYLYNYFKNKIYSDTRTDTENYLKNKNFDIDQSRFEAIPENSQQAFKGVVDMASKYQIKEGRYYSEPVLDPTTGQWVIQEHETQNRGDKNFAETLGSLMVSDPTLARTYQLYEKIKPGAGKQLMQSHVGNAFNILKVEQDKIKNDRFYAPEHVSKNQGGSGDDTPYYGGEYKGNEVKSQVLGTDSWYNTTFNSKTYNTNHEIVDDMIASIKKANPGIVNSREGAKFIDELRTMAVKATANNMKPTDFGAYLKKQLKNEQTGHDTLASFTNQSVMGEYLPEKQLNEEIRRINAQGEKQMVTDLEGKRHKISDLDDTWYLDGSSDTNLLEALSDKNKKATIVNIPIPGGVGDKQFGKAIVYNGKPYFLDMDKNQNNLAQYNQVKQIKEKGYGIMKKGDKNVFVMPSYKKGGYDIIDNFDEAFNLFTLYQTQGNHEAAKALQSTGLLNKK